MSPTLDDLRRALELYQENALRNLDWSVEGLGPDHPNTTRHRALCDLATTALTAIETAIALKSSPLSEAS